MKGQFLPQRFIHQDNGPQIISIIIVILILLSLILSLVASCISHLSENHLSNSKGRDVNAFQMHKLLWDAFCQLTKTFQYFCDSVITSTALFRMSIPRKALMQCIQPVTVWIYKHLCAADRTDSKRVPY